MKLQELWANYISKLLLQLLDYLPTTTFKFLTSMGAGREEGAKPEEGPVLGEGGGGDLSQRLFPSPISQKLLG